MSAPQSILDLLASATHPLTFDEIMAASGLTRHQTSNTLTLFQRLNLAQQKPATFSLTPDGAKHREQRLDAIARRQAAARSKLASSARRARVQRAAPQPVAQRDPAPTAAVGQIVETALRTQPNSVFALGSLS